jgi:hypothetical protein
MCDVGIDMLYITVAINKGEEANTRIKNEGKQCPPCAQTAAIHQSASTYTQKERTQPTVRVNC